jgi:hypothetical protein
MVSSSPFVYTIDALGEISKSKLEIGTDHKSVPSKLV